MQNRNFPQALTQDDLYPGRTVMWRSRDDEFRITILDWPRIETVGAGDSTVQVWVVKFQLDGTKTEMDRLVSKLGARPFRDDDWDEHNYLMPIA